MCAKVIKASNWINYEVIFETFHQAKDKDKGKDKDRDNIDGNGICLWTTERKMQNFPHQVSTYYDTRGSYFGFDKECDGDGFETGFCPNDLWCLHLISEYKYIKT